METLKQALNRAKNEVKLTTAERASSRRALEWKMGGQVRIPDDYRHQAWWLGLALVLPLIVIFLLVQPVVAPEQTTVPGPEAVDLKTETRSIPTPMVVPQRVILKQEIPALPTAPTIPPSSAGGMMLMSEPTSDEATTTEDGVEEKNRIDYNSKEN